MKWPWQLSAIPSDPPVKAPDDIADARAARVRSTADFMEAIDRNLEVTKVSRNLREHRDEFAAAIEESMRRHR